MFMGDELGAPCIIGTCRDQLLHDRQYIFGIKLAHSSICQGYVPTPSNVIHTCTYLLFFHVNFVHLCLLSEYEYQIIGECTRG